MTIEGAIQKSVIIDSDLQAVFVEWHYFYCAITANLSIAYAATIVGIVGSLILALITTFKSNTCTSFSNSPCVI